MRDQNLLTATVCWLSTATLPADNWPQWRGPTLNGVSSEAE